jgi:hypothetical protein
MLERSVRIEMTSSEKLQHTIAENAKEIQRLHKRIHETLAHRNDGPDQRSAWQQACTEFHARYDLLAFPGGYDHGKVRTRITKGDPAAMEAAICFIEVRPYFFRSGYMFNDLLRTVKRAPLSENQRARFDAVLLRWQEWRRRKHSSQTRFGD